MEKRAASLDTTLNSLNEQMGVFARKKWYQNGTIPTQGSIEKLQAEQAKLHNEMMTFTPEPPSQALYSFLSEFFVVPVKQVKLMLFTAYALALDLCAVFLLAYSLGGQGTVNPTLTRPAKPVMARHEPGYDNKPGMSEQVSTSEKPVLAHVSTPGMVSPVPGTVQVSTAESAEPANTVFQEYVEHLYPVTPRKDNSLVGRRKIRDAIGISNKEADIIHNRLKSLGVVEVRGAATYPLMGKDEALKTVGGAA